MSNLIFIHWFQPSSIVFSFGSFSIHWYGVMIALAVIAVLYISVFNAHFFNLSKEQVSDVATWLIIGCLLGARLYEVLLNFDYYLSYPGEVIAIWQGGLAIHGALLGGLITLLIYTHFKKLQIWPLLALLISSVPLGQAIGRWGNWFNQELFGLPSNLPWSIPIDFSFRPLGFENFTYFHPTFLYESLGCLLIFIILQLLVRHYRKSLVIIGAYLILYGLLRFVLEFIKIDPTPIFLGLRWPQIMSLIFVIVGTSLLFFKPKA